MDKTIMNDFECHCGHKLFKPFSRHKNGYYNECTECKTLRYAPYPSNEELQHFYENYAAYKSGLTEYLSGDDYDIFISSKKLTMKDLETPLSFFNDKKYLDIGCGTGYWLRYLTDNGFKKGYGIDTSQECVEIGKKYGINILQKEFLSITEHFDIIFMSHIIEHLKDPVSYIEHCSKLITSGGALIIETPISGAVAQAYGENWRYLMPVEHLNIFSEKALKKLLEKFGFIKVKDVTFGSGINSTSENQNDKRAMDRLSKQLNVGDTYAGYFKKN